jgi:hypothetical protein
VVAEATIIDLSRAAVNKFGSKCIQILLRPYVLLIAAGCCGVLGV